VENMCLFVDIATKFFIRIYPHMRNYQPLNCKRRQEEGIAAEAKEIEKKIRFFNEEERR